MKFIWFDHPVELRIIASNDRNKEKFRIQPSWIKTFLERYPNLQFSFTPMSTYAMLENWSKTGGGISFNADELRELCSCELPKFLKLISIGKGNYNHVRIVFEPMGTYFSDTGKHIDVLEWKRDHPKEFAEFLPRFYL